MTEIVDHYDGTVRGLDRPPVIMGHSFGGLVTEMLLHRGLGAAGVARETRSSRARYFTRPSRTADTARAIGESSNAADRRITAR